MGISLPGWPGGDPGAITMAAKAWGTFGSAVKSQVEAADATVQSALSGWEGGSAKKFGSVWSTFVEQNQKVATHANEVETALTNVARAITEAQHKYKVALGALTAATAVGIGIALVTFGIGGAIEESAAYIAATATVAAMLGTLGLDIGTAIAVVDIAWDAAIGATVGFTADPVPAGDYE